MQVFFSKFIQCGNNGGRSVADQFVMAAIFYLPNLGMLTNLSKLMMFGYFGTKFYAIELKSFENTTSGANFMQ